MLKTQKLKTHYFYKADNKPGYVYCLTCKDYVLATGNHLLTKQLDINKY